MRSALSRILLGSSVFLLLVAFGGPAGAVGQEVPELNPGSLTGALTLAGAGVALVLSRFKNRRSFN